MVQVDHVWTRITAYSNMQQYHSGLMALHKDLNFYNFPQATGAGGHRQQDCPPQRKVNTKQVSGRKNALGSLYSAEQTKTCG